jgi:hypothetical protein
VQISFVRGHHVWRADNTALEVDEHERGGCVVECQLGHGWNS